VGVTAMTVSRALRNQPSVSPALRDAIQKKASEMGYRPNPMLAALVHYRNARKKKPVRAALAWINAWADPKRLRSFREFDLYWKGAESAADKLGFRLDEFVVNEKTPLPRLEKILTTRNIQGIILPPSGQGSMPTPWDEFDWDRFSVIRISRSVDMNFHLVTADQFNNTILAFEKIRALSYERIGFVGAPTTTPRQFGAGFLWAQTELPERLRLPPLFLESNDAAANVRPLSKWLKETRPDAILTEIKNLPHLLSSAGCRVPQDIGLAATTVLDCPISAGIHQNPEEIGRIAVLQLVSMMNENERGLPKIFRHILIEGEWVDGDTLPVRSQT
jgi:LacI family transcriptional regulator